jgi:NAD(P)-dependent dehydrogenase (short-subunit alcohol dehydrogenase family)
MNQQTGTNMSGKICLVTGGTSGIGKVTASELARRGAEVVITARNQSKLNHSLEEITKLSGSESVSGLLADLTSQQAVRSLAESFLKQYPRLDVLINNAGAVYLRRTLSADGIEMTFAGNHLAPFLLTHLLLETLKTSAPARIINVSSNAHEGQMLDFNDLENRNNYQFMRAYGQSKLANILFTYELDRRLAGTGIAVNALHPGFVATNMGANNGWFVRLFLPLTRLWAISVEQGAETSIFLATSQQVDGVSGKYFYQKRAVPSSKYSYDQKVWQRLWEISAAMTGLDIDSAL